MIETFDEAYRRNLHERATAARENLRRCVRPIFATTDGIRPYPVGTCMLMDIDSRRYVVTAAHVLDETSVGALFVIGTSGTEPLQIRGKVVMTAQPPGGRHCDRIDLGFWQVSDDAVPWLGDVRFLTEGDCSRNRVSATGRQYMAMGYPYSRNKRKIDNGRATITPTIRTYTAETVELPALATEMNVSGDNHFFLRFEKTSFYSDGENANTFAPYGMSGGPLVDLGSLISVDSYDRPYRAARVAGILLECRKKHGAIVALKIERAIHAIRLARNI